MRLPRGVNGADFAGPARVIDGDTIEVSGHSGYGCMGLTLGWSTSL